MYRIELNDEQLEMVAGGSAAGAIALGGQATTVTGSTISGRSTVASSQVVAASANAHDITTSFNGNEVTSQTASGTGDTQIA